MNLSNNNTSLDLLLSNTSYIKVIGVGTGGGNVVNHLYSKGIPDVSFVVCDTDYQVLEHSFVSDKIPFGKDTAQDEIKKTLSENTRMVFVVATMGGETGTSVSSIVAQTAKKMGILTIGIITIPFAFEGSEKVYHAFEGMLELSKHVDSILVINNEKLKETHADLNFSNAFAIADDVLANVIKDIVTTITSYHTIDFDDINTTMKNGKVATVNTGFASGENRISKAIENALVSPLFKTSDLKRAKKILLNLYCSHEYAIKKEEITQIHKFMAEVGSDIEIIWGASFDDTLNDMVKVTLIATGFDLEDILEIPESILKK